MQKYLITTALLGGMAIIGLNIKNKPVYQKVKPVDVAYKFGTPQENYANYCSGCHGEKMDAFTDRQWKHGYKQADLEKSIKNGWTNEGMPAFAETFSDQEVKELAAYILEGIKNTQAYNFDDVKVTGIFESEKLTVKLDTIATGFNVPWGMAFLPDASMLVTERGGKLYNIKNKKKQEIKGVPEVLAEGQGGPLEGIPLGIKD
ncbi:MAG: c-type cytochrome, partial [Bacteroidota bacterium]